MRSKPFWKSVAALLVMELTACAGSPDRVGMPVEARLIPHETRFDRLIPPGTVVEKIADGFTWVEGPVWHREGGYLLFSDIPSNRIMRWKAGEGVTVYLSPSGYTGRTPFTGKEPGSNGIALDAEGRVVFCAHGDRRIIRVEPDGSRTTLAFRYDDRHLNSPNDLVFKSNGDLYFTDPPFGLPGAFDDPGKAPYQGVYRTSPDGTITLVIKDVKAPNGIAFSPDEKTLYVSDVDPDRAAWLAYEVQPDGTATNGRVLFHATRWRKDPYFGPDGFKLDRHGNLFGARPGGINVIGPDGVLLGTIETGRPTSNLAWGEDGSVLYVTGGSAVYRIETATKGAGW